MRNAGNQAYYWDDTPCGGGFATVYMTYCECGAWSLAVFSAVIIAACMHAAL